MCVCVCLSTRVCMRVCVFDNVLHVAVHACECGGCVEGGRGRGGGGGMHVMYINDKEEQTNVHTFYLVLRKRFESRGAKSVITDMFCS